MNKSELANIDKFKGVIIEPNGIAHSFGHCLMIPNEHNITGEEHEEEFKKTILSSPWWANYNVSYDDSKNYYSQLEEITKTGFSVIQNNSSVTARGNRYVSYSFALSTEGLEGQKDYLSSVYPVISKLMSNEDSPYAEFALYENGEIITDVFTSDIQKVDEIYKDLGIESQKEEKIGKIK